MSNPRIFGSVAQHQEHAHSDIDLLVDVDPDLDLLDLIDAASELEALLGREWISSLQGPSATPTLPLGRGA